MKFEGPKNKPINIDGPELNQFDTSKLEEGKKVLQKALEEKERELAELEAKLSTINEREEELRERYDQLIDRARASIHKYQGLIKTYDETKLEVESSMGEELKKWFGNGGENSEMIQ